MTGKRVLLTLISMLQPVVFRTEQPLSTEVISRLLISLEPRERAELLSSLIRIGAGNDISEDDYISFFDALSGRFRPDHPKLDALIAAVYSGRKLKAETLRWLYKLAQTGLAPRFLPFEMLEHDALGIDAASALLFASECLRRVVDDMVEVKGASEQMGVFSDHVTNVARAYAASLPPQCEARAYEKFHEAVDDATPPGEILTPSSEAAS